MSPGFSAATPAKPEFDHVPDHDRDRDERRKRRSEPRGHRAFGARLEPVRGAGEQQREGREAREGARLAAIGEALGADEIFRDRAEEQRKGVEKEIDVHEHHARIEQRLAGRDRAAWSGAIQTVMKVSTSAMASGGRLARTQVARSMTPSLTRYSE